MAEAAGARLETALDGVPVSEAQRIESLDVLRGFALLGILLLNIIGFGLPSAAYSYPAVALEGLGDHLVWGGVELFAEGAMRCLFSILFGAGVALFTETKAGAVHFRRNGWLLAFGLFDAYVLLWSGDILINYALAGFVLYFVRHTSARRLLISAGVLIVLMSAMHAVMQLGMHGAWQAAEQVAADPDNASAELVEYAAGWEEFRSDYQPSPDELEEELSQRRASYASAFAWNVPYTTDMLLFVLPVFLFWDALAMMLLGMGLYKLGVLQGDRGRSFSRRLMLVGFSIGLLVNGYEVTRAVTSDFDLFATFAQMQWTYHIGRLGMAFGWMGLVLFCVQGHMLAAMRARLAAVGRMALTNYLMHSLLCLFLFTGAGLALVGTLTRAELYIVVLGIWVLQLLLSPWWLARYRFGPVEWLWRGLTYGRFPDNRR